MAKESNLCESNTGVNQSTAVSSVAVCTLWEGDYHKGLAVLANSLYRCGFRGRIWAGYRGSIPTWAQDRVWADVTHVMEPAPGLEIAFVKLDTEEHFSQYKAVWCTRVLEEYAPSSTGVYYFDPDIFVLAEWTFFEAWLDVGIAVCEDSHYPLTPNHPIAARMQAFARNSGYSINRAADFYLNSGLVGLKQEHRSFLNDWKTLIKAIQGEYSSGGLLKAGTRANLFHNFDQDALTIALWTTQHPVSRVGVDGMGFSRGEWLTLHATAEKKPWRRKVMRDLLFDGKAPDSASRLYWEFATTPIQIESQARVERHRWLIPLAALVSRFYRRS